MLLRSGSIILFSFEQSLPIYTALECGCVPLSDAPAGPISFDRTADKLAALCSGDVRRRHDIILLNMQMTAASDAAAAAAPAAAAPDADVVAAITNL